MSGQWSNDPTGRHQHRFWDGTSWTDTVSDNGLTSVDPIDSPPHPPVLPPTYGASAPLQPPQPNAPMGYPTQPGPPPYAPQPYPPQQFGQPANQPASQKVAAGICGILLGAFGVHKFILGYKTEGIIMLVGGILTCGTVTGVIGLIEGIIYLTKSDAEFVQTYQVGKKTWF